MTRRISLITAVAGLAFVLAVPVASGQGQPVDFWNYDEQGRKISNTSPGIAPESLAALYSSGGLQGPVSPDAVDRAVAAREAQQAATSSYPDVVERAVAARNTAGRSLVFDNQHVLTGGDSSQVARPYPDVVDRAVTARATEGRSLVFDNHRTGGEPQSAGRTLVFDNHRLDGARLEQVSATSSGREIEWPQLGIGFGIGIALMLGFWLVLRMTHTRPLAH